MIFPAATFLIPAPRVRRELMEIPRRPSAPFHSAIQAGRLPARKSMGIRERAERVEHRERIPTFLELNALPLDRLTVKQRIDIDG